ncbi:hypothetical protein [Priestia filamentosa]|uniref:hypothetical protein n=1 Tax=Priestia filamentosa TaxID=1402861 RepID=UPI003982637D
MNKRVFASQQLDESHVKDELIEFQKATTEITGKEKKEIYKDAVEKATNGDLAVHANGDLSNVDDYKVYKVDNEQTTGTLVTLNLHNEKAVLHSFSILLNKENKVSGSGEYVVKQLDDQTGNVKSYENGKLTADLNVDIPKEESTSDKVQTMSIGSWFDQWSKCMEKYSGLPSWATRAINMACMAACLTVAGCVACVYAQAAINGWDAGYCVGYANDHS